MCVVIVVGLMVCVLIMFMDIVVLVCSLYYYNVNGMCGVVCVGVVVMIVVCDVSVWDVIVVVVLMVVCDYWLCVCVLCVLCCVVCDDDDVCGCVYVLM